MKLDLSLQSRIHKDVVTGVAWTSENELITTSDDHTIQRWNMEGEHIGKVASYEGYITSVSLLPSSGKRSSDMMAAAFSDGSIRLLGRNGREEKKTKDAHHGAVIAIEWNLDGSALASAGEDGAVKIWSKNIDLRSTLISIESPVYSLSWGPDNDQIIIGARRELIIKTVTAGKRQLKWLAHDGVIMAVAWNTVNNLIVSGSEDRTFKVWDSFGRQLSQSSPAIHVITAVSWSPNGEVFAVGASNVLCLCDRTGWSHSRERPDGGSILDITWTNDGTRIAAACGGGAVLFAHVIGKTVEWENYHATLADPKRIVVIDTKAGGTQENLDFPRDRVVEMTFGNDHLIVATSTQCFIYSGGNWNTPHIFDLRGAASLIVTSQKYFAIVDSLAGVQVYNYEGRLVANPRFQGLRPEFLNAQSLSLSKDCVAILDRTDGQTIKCYDISLGKFVPKPVTHSMDITEISLSQYGRGLSDRLLAFVDRNRDLFLTTVVPSQAISTASSEPYKLFTQIDSIAWHDSSDMLIAVGDGRLMTWYYPNIVHVDRDLLNVTTVVRPAPEFRTFPRLKSFSGSRISVRRADGSLLYASTSPFPPILYEFYVSNRWDDAIRLCRHVKEEALWGCLTGMAIQSRNLEVAELGLAALMEVDKLKYIKYIKEIPSEEGRNAEIALYRRNIDEAEMILLQASPPFVFRAIMMNISIFRWERALDIAIKHKVHVDTVLAYRQTFLERFGKKEIVPRFQQYMKEVEIDWEKITARMDREAEEENARSRIRQ